MKKYEYNRFEIDPMEDLTDALNTLGRDGWHVYKQKLRGKVIVVWASRKI